MVRGGQLREAQGELAIRVATGLQKSGLPNTSLIKTLYPIDIKIDNETSDQYTVMQINSVDTFGFLFLVHQCPGLEPHLYRPGVGGLDRQPGAGHPIRHRRGRA